jgi:hypothetical protein
MSKEAIIALLDEIREESTEVGNRTEKRSITPPDLSTIYIKLADAIEALVDEVPDGGALPYKVYTALANQEGTDAPVMTVLENTLGFDPAWNYDTIGAYYTSNSQFLVNKTALIVSTGVELSNQIRIINYDTDIYIETYNSGAAANGVLQRTFLEIRIYE